MYTIKVIHEKLTDNMVLSVEILKSFHLKTGMRKECPLSPFLFNTIDS
jgi:hypothetical protein